MRARPTLLDLCCKAGGASAGYHAAGFDVTGVDIEPQPDYPFLFIHADALTVDLYGYDVVAASPPCQAYSQATPVDRRDRHPDLIAPLRRRLIEAVAAPGGPWAYVIENVPGAPLHHPILVCGDSLRLGVRRHRLFESNLPLHGTPCWHDRTTPAVPVYGSYGQRSRQNPLDVEGEPSPRPSTELARAAMGIDWMPWPALTQAIPPAYTHWLGVQLLTHQQASCDNAPSAGVLSPTRDETRRRDTTTAVLTSPGRDTTDPVASVTGDTTPPPVASVTGDTTPPAGLRHRVCRCGTPLPPRPVTGRWPRHCSQACRQAAYRARRSA
jgi:hypothetical protein